MNLFCLGDIKYMTRFQMVVVSCVGKMHPFQVCPQSRANTARDMKQDSTAFTGFAQLPVDPLWGCLGSNNDFAVRIIAFNDSQGVPV